MPGSIRKYRVIKRIAAYSAAFAVPAALLAGAPPMEESASASEIAANGGFEQAFAPYALPAGTPILSPSERLAAELLSSSAPVEVEPEQEESSIGTGSASYYGARFAGRKTANGEIFNPRKLTAAHRTLPFGSKVKVTNRRNGKSVVVRINDRGPFARGRVIDLSKAAAQRIGLVRAGHGPVELALLD